MQNYRQRTRLLLLEDLKHNPQFSHEQVGTYQKDIKESDCINPFMFIEDISYYLRYYNIPQTTDNIFHMTQVFEKFNRFEVLRDAPKTPHKTKNEYVLQLNINYYYGERKPASTFFKEIQDKYCLTYRGSKDFFEFAKTLPSVTVKHGKKRKHSSIISYCGYENDPFFADESISTWRRASMFVVLMHIQENRCNVFNTDNTFINHVVIKNKTDSGLEINKEIVDSLPEYYNTSIDLAKINNKMRANVSQLAYLFFAYERVFTKKRNRIYGGRLYSKFTQMPRAMRERMINVCGLKSVDMTSSQMNLLYQSSFRKAPPDNHFDFYKFFLNKAGIHEKYFDLFRDFSKLACSLMINANRSKVSYILQTYLAEEGLLYTHEEMKILNSTKNDVRTDYNKFDITGDIYKDIRVQQIKSSIYQSRVQRLKKSKLKSLDKKFSQKELVALTYSLPKKIEEYFNYANILNFKSNSTIVESNSMIKLLNSTDEFILSIHDEFIVSKNSDSEKFDNKFHSYISNESIRFSKGIITNEYVSLNTNELKNNTIKIIKLNTYLPIKQYIIKSEFSKVCFLT